MSVAVDLAELGTVLGEYDAGYLLSTTQGRVKAVTVDPELIEGALVVREPGGGSSRNIIANAQVTVLFPPLERHGYTLLVDGTATLDGDDALVAPVSAVLHRPAARSDGPARSNHDGCGHDCRHL